MYGRKGLYGEHANVHQSHSDLRDVAGGDGELGCLCGKAGTGHFSAHSSRCVVNGYGCLLRYYLELIKDDSNFGEKWL